MNTKKNINLKHIFLFILFLNFQNKTFTMFVDDSEIKTPLSIPREMLVQPIPRRTSSADFFSLSIFLSDDHNKFINFVLSQRTPENIILLKQFGGILERIEELISTIRKRYPNFEVTDLEIILFNKINIEVQNFKTSDYSCQLSPEKDQLTYMLNQVIDKQLLLISYHIFEL